MTTVEIALELYDQITDIPGDPNRALGYISNHFNIDRVSWSIWAYPPYNLNQVYYSTYVEPSRYKSLQHFFTSTHKQLDDALAKERLELQKKYGRYQITNEIPTILLDCFL